MTKMKVYCTIGMQAAVEAMLPQLEAASGCTLAFTWATAPMLTRRLQSGEKTDVMILNRAGIETMVKEGRIAAGTPVKLAGSPVALAVKSGTPKPDISTPEALKQALLSAKSISYTDPAAGGASGVYFAQLIERLGIAKEVNAKNTYPPAGGFSGALLLTGQAEIAIQQKPELLHIAGIEIIGQLPGDLNMVTVFAAGIETTSPNAAAARKLIAFLQSQEAATILRSKGLDPDAE
jgi:molybdate transport system substrate-binding protein